jgi:hypothetical protein
MKQTQNTRPARLPAVWHISLLLCLLVGLLLIVINFPIAILIPLTDTVQQDMWSRFLGIYIVSIVISHWVVYFTHRFVSNLFAIEDESTTADLWSPTLVGMLESVMYPAMLIVNYPDFIGFWLAIKVAGQWVAWKGEDKSDNGLSEEAKKGRRRFNRFLIGNSLRIILAGFTFFVLRATVFAK